MAGSDKAWRQIEALQSRRELRKAREALRQLDRVLPPEQRTPTVGNLQQLSTAAESPGVREAVEFLNRDDVQKTIQQMSTAAQAPAVEQALEFVNRPDVRKAMEQLDEVRGGLVGRAIEWLERKWGERPCPYCGVVDWLVGTPLEVGVEGDDAMSPAFPVMCGNCGQTVLVNAVVADLVDEPEEDR